MKYALVLGVALVLAACAAPASPAAPTAAPTSAPVAPTALPPTATPLPATPTPNPPTTTPLPPATATLVPSPTPVPASPTPAQKEVMVIIHNFEFVPKFVTVTVGTKVTWLVEQGTHTTTSDDFRTKGPNSWHSGDLTVGQKFSFTFNNAGTFRYFCGFHSEPGQPLTAGNMNGAVTVQ